MEAAEKAFSHGLAISTNDDMRVAYINWLYLIKKRLDKNEAAKAHAQNTSIVKQCQT
jgi:hypothetical protein